MGEGAGPRISTERQSSGHGRSRCLSGRVRRRRTLLFAGRGPGCESSKAAEGGVVELLSVPPVPVRQSPGNQ